MTAANLLIVDDHPIVRLGLAQLVESEPTLRVAGEAADARDAMSVLRQAKIDLVLLDLSLRTGSGIDLLRQIRLEWPTQKVLVISMHDETLYAERMIRAGACGYVMKGLPAAELIRGLHRALRGEIIVGDAVASRILLQTLQGQLKGGNGPMDVLSDRELEVFEMIGRGLGARAIASALRIGIKTVESHQYNIRNKLALTSMNDVRRHAMAWVASR